jgi:[glutamine synthetase] adenylyltransferase / [glutamine synthetase]-adenylyl-L-tyrosine phosphorylase
VNRLLSSLLARRPPAKATVLKLFREHGFRDPAAADTAIHRLYADDLQRRALAKIFPHLVRTCAASADPDRALLNFERLVAALPNLGMFYHYLQEAPDRMDLLVKVFAHSQALSDTLARNASYFHFLIAPETLKVPREKKWLAAELSRLRLPARVPAEKYDVVRRFRRRETLRIGVRDLVGRATVEETTLELSNLADVCLQAVYEIAAAKLQAEFKVLGSRFTVIGMGKLGGQELNYSSDVDVIFVYGEDEQLTPNLSAHQFYTKLAEEIVRAVGTKSEEGTIFRIDLRLRPEGSSGPLARSLESCENYYAEWGETWERMALVKARPVAGDAGLGGEFIEMVQPFVYSRQAGTTVIQEMAVLKQRIEDEIVRDDRLTRHVKLGVGGIREIEFIVQAFQILRGGRVPALQERSTLRALPRLVKTRTLTEKEAGTLADAYRFLRNVEHRLQMEMELQTHTIPDEEHAQYRLARSLSFKTVEDFQKARQRHTAAVRRIYELVLSGATEAAPVTLAAGQLTGFADPAAAMKIIDGLWHGSGFTHVSPRTQELFSRLLPLIVKCCGQLAEPDAALTRFEEFVSAYGSRGLLYELLVRNPKLIEMLLRVSDASKFFAVTLVKQPELFDEVCRGVALDEPRPLLSGDGDPMEVARAWKRAELLRIGIGDVLRLVDLPQVLAEITGLADTCLRFAVEQSRRELKLKKLPFIVVGMGKFGGQELGYGADLDVLFVGDQERATRLAARVIEFMARQTSAGKLFDVDARLRPDGEQGSLAGSLEAHRDYYAKRAQLWERLALTKARVVAGDADYGAKFMKMVSDRIYATPLTAEEAKEIRQMRHRVETERGDQQHVELEFKTGPGALFDVEFLIQSLQLQHGPAHPPVRTTHTLAALNRLAALGLVEEGQASQLRQHYLFLRRIESVLRCMENASVSRLPAEKVEQSRLANRLGFAGREEFMGAYGHATRRIRVLYEQLRPGA